MNWQSEIAKGLRFKFGENWQDFSNNLSDSMIKDAILCTKKSLNDAGVEIRGKTVIDIGCGSGLFSLAALDLGAKFITSFDYDPSSVECTRKLLQSKNFSNNDFEVLEGSILDDEFISRLSKYDLVYSWGVLHHTGNLKKALKNSCNLTKKNGIIFIALYQKTFLDPIWKIEKRFYSSSSKRIQIIIDRMFIFLIRITYILKRKSFKNFVKNYSNNRGMNYYRDISDWLGGYPYEGITVEECIKFFSRIGFQKLLINKRGKFFAKVSSNNEYIFKK